MHYSLLTIHSKNGKADFEERRLGRMRDPYSIPPSYCARVTISFLLLCEQSPHKIPLTKASPIGS